MGYFDYTGCVLKILAVAGVREIPAERLFAAAKVDPAKVDARQPRTEWAVA
jgi:hypothetical protein